MAKAAKVLTLETRRVVWPADFHPWHRSSSEVLGCRRCMAVFWERQAKLERMAEKGEEGT